MFDYISNLWVVVVIMIVFNDQLTIASIPRHFWGSYVPFHPVSQFMIIKRTLATLHYANVK